MTELTLELDQKATQNLSDLMKHYRVKNRAEIISKALSVLQIAAYVETEQGKLFARKGNHETEILVT